MEWKDCEGSEWMEEKRREDNGSERKREGNVEWKCEWNAKVKKDGLNE